MENRINQVITLETGDKYVILHQAIYNNENYYACAKVTEDGNDATEDFTLFHEIKDEDKISVEMVEDDVLARFILEHLDLMEKAD